MKFSDKFKDRLDDLEARIDNIKITFGLTPSTVKQFTPNLNNKGLATSDKNNKKDQRSNSSDKTQSKTAHDIQESLTKRVVAGRGPVISAIKRVIGIGRGK